MTTVSERAIQLIKNGQVIGLGTGRAATAFIQALGERVRAGLRVRGVPTSQSTADLAAQQAIPLLTLDQAIPIDVTVDGADEVDPQLNLIKGYGGALVREKIVAAASRRLVILIGSDKLVPMLGTRGKIPVEIVPFGLALCSRRLADLGCQPVPRKAGDQLYLTDNGNYILDCAVSPIPDPAEFDRTICCIPGVVGTGLFVGMAHTVLVQDGESVRVLERSST